MKEENINKLNDEGTLKESNGALKNLVEGIKDLLKDYQTSKYRKDREKNIKFIDNDIKKKIIESSKSIPMEIKNDGDGNIIYEISLGGEKYNIKRINIKKHADRYEPWPGVSKREYVDKEIHAHQIRGNNIDYWKNKKLGDHIKLQEKNGYYRPSENLINRILGNLGKQANINTESDEIAMLMYLTGIKGNFFLLQKEGKQSIPRLECDLERRVVGGYVGGMGEGEILLISKKNSN